MPDAQATVADAAAVVAVAHALVVWLAERHDAGEPLPATPTWRIEENRWRACRYGVEGELRDLAHAASRSPPGLDCTRCSTSSSRSPRGSAARRSSARARALVERNGAMRLRDAARSER